MPDWETPEGFTDMGKFPIDRLLRQALDGDAERLRSACSVVATKWRCAGRRLPALQCPGRASARARECRHRAGGCGSRAQR